MAQSLWSIIMRRTESTMVHLARTNVQLHDRLVKRFMLSDRDDDVDMMIKLSSSIGYIQQTQSAISKNIYTERDIKAINTRLDRIPPELLQKFTNPTVLEPELEA
jgi:CRISPR/Cas system-associated endonuclease Cas3-HD